jgi:predicted acylesterase/phospholipase RssA
VGSHWNQRVTRGTGKPGVVFSGGSAYAAYEVGVMQALVEGRAPSQREVPTEPYVFSGSSAGAVNAAWMASQPAEPLTRVVNDLRSFWLDGVAAGCGTGAIRYRANATEFLDPWCLSQNPGALIRRWIDDAAFFLDDWSQRALRFSLGGGTLIRRLVELVDLGTIVSVEPLRELLADHLSFAGVRTSPHRVAVAATNWLNGELKTFENHDMSDEDGVDIIMAASAFPGLPPVYIAGEPYVDGGYVMDTPLMPAIDAGADTIHVIYLDPDPANVPIHRLHSTIEVIDRLFVILRATIYHRDIVLASRVNDGLTLLEQTDAAQLSTSAMKAFIQSIAAIKSRIEMGRPYRKIRIHRYHPSDDLGGVAGLLNFDRDQIAQLIDRGYDDAVMHDCTQSGCVLPAGN